jgi:hypothetical protein
VAGSCVGATVAVTVGEAVEVAVVVGTGFVVVVAVLWLGDSVDDEVVVDGD